MMNPPAQPLALAATQISSELASPTDATLAAPSLGTGALPATASFSAPVSAARTTILPKIEGDGTRVELSLEPRSRYEASKLLGAGGMGEVVLVRDLDIERKVALKRLLPEMDDPAILARFVDEIRTVGRLEHPNIVPIHDVGVDELGRYFFVMKYVEGETLESIIEKLAAGDPAYLAKYSIEVRIELFLGVLHALEYAHAQGVVHRDIKPANVMVGRYGEVVLMDWGIARSTGMRRDPATTAEGEIAGEGERSRMFATRVGSLVGTPAYMSPEQARGDNAAVDARSDLYSAMVLFHELIGLQHYLGEHQTMESLLGAIKGPRLGFFDVLGIAYPGNKKPPAELVHLFVKGLEKDPANRFQSAGELIAALHACLEGKVRVQCQFTLAKRIYRELGRLEDRSPFLGFFLLVSVLAALGFTGVQLVRMALG